jgi:hypothetical protein
MGTGDTAFGVMATALLLSCIVQWNLDEQPRRMYLSGNMYKYYSEMSLCLTWMYHRRMRDYIVNCSQKFLDHLPNEYSQIEQVSVGEISTQTMQSPRADTVRTFYIVKNSQEPLNRFPGGCSQIY